VRSDLVLLLSKNGVGSNQQSKFVHVDPCIFRFKFRTASCMVLILPKPIRSISGLWCLDSGIRHIKRLELLLLLRSQVSHSLAPLPAPPLPTRPARLWPALSGGSAAAPALDNYRPAPPALASLSPALVGITYILH